MSRLAGVVLLIVMALGTTRAIASTAAFAGEVVAVKKLENNKDALAEFTVKIYFYDYCSWNKFNRDSKVGEVITRRVKKIGSVCMINGRLVNATTFAAAIKTGQWGYFYEDTWLDLQTTPDFKWGEVIAHDAGRKQLTLRVHYSHKDYHVAANPPKDMQLKYESDTLFLVENKVSDASELKAGRWVQVHEPRPQYIMTYSPDSNHDPKEWQPHGDGKRGFANDLTAPAILKRYETKNPTGVIDQSVQLNVSRLLNGKWEDVAMNCKKTSFVLDGKLAPINIAAKPGRRLVLGHYRKETSPHKIFVRSHDDGLRGKIIEAGANSLRIRPTADGLGNAAKETTAKLADDAVYQHNGRPVSADGAILVGREIAVLPAHGLVMKVFQPH